MPTLKEQFTALAKEITKKKANKINIPRLRSRIMRLNDDLAEDKEEITPQLFEGMSPEALKLAAQGFLLICASVME